MGRRRLRLRRRAPSPSLEYSDDEWEDDGDDDDDLRSQVGGSEAYKLVSERAASRERTDDETVLVGRRRRPSASTVASFQLYTPDEDRAVRRKFDRKLVLFVALLFMLSFLDRSSTFPHALA